MTNENRKCVRSDLLEWHVDVAVLFQPVRHRAGFFRAHEIRIEQFLTG